MILSTRRRCLKSLRVHHLLFTFFFTSIFLSGKLYETAKNDKFSMEIYHALETASHGVTRGGSATEIHVNENAKEKGITDGARDVLISKHQTEMKGTNAIDDVPLGKKSETAKGDDNDQHIPTSKNESEMNGVNSSFQISAVDHSSRALRQADEQIQAVARELEELNIRYYLYDHPNITLEGNANMKKKKPAIWEAHYRDIEYDDQIFAALKNSPLRTKDPEEADMYIPPINLGMIYASQGSDFSPIDYVLQDDYFRKYDGHKHVFLCTCFALFKRLSWSMSGLKNYYAPMYNVTVIQSYDPSAIYNELHHTEGADWGEFNFLKDKIEPLVRRSASIGLGSVNEIIELVPASKEKFDNSSNLIFYHSRTAGSLNNSTIFRHSPIQNITLENFPKSSIGWEIEKEEWERNFRDSKFCLNIRGDSPHSHALWRSIRIGCIPVIVSNSLPVFAPMLKSSLNMTDYAVILDEQEVVNNPQDTLRQLEDIPEETIELKIKHLAFAQRVLFSDHPQSLFIPAFVKEAKMATEVRLVS